MFDCLPRETKDTSVLDCAPNDRHDDQLEASSGVADLDQQSAVVRFRSLMLSQFRSYGAVTLDLDPASPMVVLTGENGAGKTNLLEAISFYAPGRGMRSSGLLDVCKVGSGQPWAVAAEIVIGDSVERIGTGLDPDGFRQESTTAKRIVRFEGESHSPNMLAPKLTVSWLTPQMDRLFTEAPSSRRNFLDRLVLGLYPDHSRQVSAYERVMRERNKLLSEQGMRADTSWLKVLEAQMAEHATAVALARLDFTGQLAGLIEETSDDTSAFPKALLSLDGVLEGQLNDGMTASDVEQHYREALMAARAVDAQKGRASIGPHKTDLLVTHAPKDMPAGLCSTGEQKALLINLILANARLKKMLTGTAPVLLLDEIAAHLDAHRRAALFDALFDLGGQCWMTGTDKSLFSALDGQAQFFSVQAGKISQ